MQGYSTDFNIATNMSFSIERVVILRKIGTLAVLLSNTDSATHLAVASGRRTSVSVIHTHPPHIPPLYNWKKHASKRSSQPYMTIDIHHL
jgi:hypothetical protein